MWSCFQILTVITTFSKHSRIYSYLKYLLKTFLPLLPAWYRRMPPFLHASACIILYPLYYNHMNKLTCSGETMKQNSFPFRYLSTQTPCTRCLSPPFQFSLYSRKSNLSGKIYKQAKTYMQPTILPIGKHKSLHQQTFYPSCQTYTKMLLQIQEETAS